MDTRSNVVIICLCSVACVCGAIQQLIDMSLEAKTKKKKGKKKKERKRKKEKPAHCKLSNLIAKCYTVLRACEMLPDDERAVAVGEFIKADSTQTSIEYVPSLLTCSCCICSGFTASFCITYCVGCLVCLVTAFAIQMFNTLWMPSKLIQPLCLSSKSAYKRINLAVSCFFVFVFFFLFFFLVCIVVFV